jgi:hypothetical protein
MQKFQEVATVVFTISIVKESFPSRLKMENLKFQALNPKQYQMTKIQSTKRFLPLEHADFSIFPKNSPLKIRGARPARRTNSLAGGGVMKITPFIPLTLRGIATSRAIEYLTSKHLVFSCRYCFASLAMTRGKGLAMTHRMGTRLKSRTTFITPLPPLTLRGELCVTGRHGANPPAKPLRAGASHYIFDQPWQQKKFG